MGSSLNYLPMPLTIRPSRKASETDLETFVHSNQPFITERDASGALAILAPEGETPEMDCGSYLHLLPHPLTIITSEPVSDLDLIRFSRGNKHLRIEKDTHGELLIRDTIGFNGSRRRMALVFPLLDWAEQDGRGKANGGNVGWNLADGSTLSPDASWTSNGQLRRFRREEHESFLPICPDFIAEIRAKVDYLADLHAKMA